MRMLSVPLALAASLGLTACAAPGILNGYSKDPMAMVMTWKNPDFKSPMTSSEYKVVVRHANWCNDTVVKPQLSGGVEAAATGAAVEAVPALAIAPAALNGIKGGTGGLVREIVGLNAGGGLATGVIVGSQAHANAVGTCVSENLKDSPTQALAPGVHAAVAIVRSRNRSNADMPAGMSAPGSVPSAAQSRE